MKTFKTLAIITLAVTFTFGPVSQVFAGPNVYMKGWNKPKTAGNWGTINKNANLGGPITKIPQPGPAPNQPPANNNGHDHGYNWGAFAGGTVMGLVMSSAANQPQQQTQPTVVYVQQTTEDTDTRQHLELEIERERAKRLALEAELERLKAERQ